MDTLTISQTLKDAGAKQELAEAIAKAIDERGDDVATKEFVRAEMNQLRSEMNELRVEVTSQFNKLTLIMITLTGIILAAVKYL